MQTPTAAAAAAAARFFVPDLSRKMLVLEDGFADVPTPFGLMRCYIFRPKPALEGEYGAPSAIKPARP